MRTARLAQAMLVLALIAGCGESPGPVGARAFEHAQALYAVANRRASDRLEMMAEKIAADAESGALSEHEAALLNAVLDDARVGDWKAAANAARQIMEAQASR